MEFITHKKGERMKQIGVSGQRIKQIAVITQIIEPNEIDNYGIQYQCIFDLIKEKNLRLLICEDPIVPKKILPRLKLLLKLFYERLGIAWVIIENRKNVTFTKKDYFWDILTEDKTLQKDDTIEFELEPILIESGGYQDKRKLCYHCNKNLVVQEGLCGNCFGDKEACLDAMREDSLHGEDR
jgi:hypothetical protein